MYADQPDFQWFLELFEADEAREVRNNTNEIIEIDSDSDDDVPSAPAGPSSADCMMMTSLPASPDDHAQRIPLRDKKTMKQKKTARDARDARENAREPSPPADSPPMQPGRPNKCAICASDSSVYHYDVPSCNSCKVFFRRMILKQTEHQCPRDGKCHKNASKRQFLLCRYCRFKKCVEMGMNPLAIVTKQNLFENVLVKKILSQRKQVVVQEEQSLQVPCLLEHMDDRVGSLLQHLDYLEDKHQAVRRSTYCPRTYDGIDTAYLLNTPSSLGMNYQPMQEMQGWPLMNDPKTFDVQMPLDLHVKYRITMGEATQYRERHNLKEWMFVDLIYAVDYIKAFDIMHDFDYVDKVNLLRHISLKVSALTTSFFSFMNKSIIAFYPDGRTPYRHHEISTKSNPWFAPKYMQEMGLIKPVYLLMKAIVVCDPSAEGVSAHAQEILGREREKYATTLMRYLMASYGPKKAPVMYLQCMKLLEIMDEQLAKIRNADEFLLTMKLKVKSKIGHELRGIS